MQAMLDTRLNEHAKLSKQINELEAAKKRKAAEIEELLIREGQDAALNDGVEFEGFKLKRVKGETSTLNKKELMSAFDLSVKELEAFYDRKPKKAYLSITPPGKTDE